MANWSAGHDAYFLAVGSDGSGLSQQVTVTSATGTSTTPFGSQTRAVQIIVGGTLSSTAQVFVKFYSTGSPVSQASSTADAAIPLNWCQVYKITPGQRASFIAADATTSYRAYVSELVN
jgi:hypothetical protein